MLLKNHLIKVFKQASLENNLLLKENVVLKWVHRFGIDSLNDLLINTSEIKENQNAEENQVQISLTEEVFEEENQDQISLTEEVLEEENQDQISLTEEVLEEENQDQITLELSKTFGNNEEIKCESNSLENASSTEILRKNQDSNNLKQSIHNQKLPLPNIKNLRKWINKDKKAS